MNKLLETVTGRPTEVVHRIEPQTLDQLWHEAEKLGRVVVDCDIITGAYKVEIRWKRPSGTRIYARGTDTEIKNAVAKAINEAMELGDGEAP